MLPVGTVRVKVRESGNKAALALLIPLFGKEGSGEIF